MDKKAEVVDGDDGDRSQGPKTQADGDRRRHLLNIPSCCPVTGTRTPLLPLFSSVSSFLSNSSCTSLPNSRWD